MIAYSDAAKRAIGETIDSVSVMIASAESALGENLGENNFAMNVLANVVAKFILARAAARCAILADADAEAIRTFARLETAQVLAAFPSAILGYIDANAVAMAATADLLNATTQAAAKGSVQ
jgi:hypothetical protein